VALDYVSLIEKYGYVATFAGSVIEGESLLILSGLAAHRGYLSFPLVVLVGALGGAIGDMAFFLLGRYYGSALLARFPRFAPAADHVHAMIERHPVATILAVRFMYGLRTAGPAIIGTTRPVKEANRMQKLDELFNLLKGRREVFKQINPGKEFHGIAVLQVDREVEAVIVKSVFQTCAPLSSRTAWIPPGAGVR